jgi:hypothetical protein
MTLSDSGATDLVGEVLEVFFFLPYEGRGRRARESMVEESE